MAIKNCFVPTCFNSSEQNTNKLFIMVPLRDDIRMRWCAAVSRPFSKTKQLYCCEDHFNLKFDMMNWMEYKLIGSRIYMREDVFPHKFINSPKPTIHPLKSQLSSSSRKRRSYSLEKLGDKIKRKFDLPSSDPEDPLRIDQIDSPPFEFTEVPVSYHFEESFNEECESRLSTPTQITNHQPEQIPNPTFDKKIQVNIKPKCRSVCIGTSIRVRSCGTNTTNLKKTVSRSCC